MIIMIVSILSRKFGVDAPISQLTITYNAKGGQN